MPTSTHAFQTVEAGGCGDFGDLAWCLTRFGRAQSIAEHRLDVHQRHTEVLVGAFEKRLNVACKSPPLRQEG